MCTEYALLNRIGMLFSIRKALALVMLSVSQPAGERARDRALAYQGGAGWWAATAAYRRRTDLAATAVRAAAGRWLAEHEMSHMLDGTRTVPRRLHIVQLATPSRAPRGSASKRPSSFSPLG